MTKNKEPVIETVTIKCPHCGKIVDITEGFISPNYTCKGTIPVYVEDGGIQLDWSSLDIHDVTFDFYCPECTERVTDWIVDLEELHKKCKKALTKKKARNESRRSDP